MEKIIIEKAKIEDIERLKKIRDVAFDTDMRYFPDGILPGSNEEYDGIEPTSVEYLQTDGNTIFKIILGKEIIGAACVTALKDGIRNIDEFYISPDYMGKNIGATALSLVEIYFSDTKTFRLFTPTQVMKNIVFYVNKCSYHIVKVENYDRIKECGDYVFEKSIG